MLSLAAHYEDIKPFGPFGSTAHSITECDDLYLLKADGALHAIFAQFSPVNHTLIAIQFVHKKFGRIFTKSDLLNGAGLETAIDQDSAKGKGSKIPGDIFPAKIHKTTAPHAGKFDALTEHSFVERLILSDNEFIITAQLSVAEVVPLPQNLNSFELSRFLHRV